MRTLKIAIALIALFIIQSGFIFEAKASQIEIKSGIWKSDGNAQVLVVENETYQFYDLTSISCVTSTQGQSKDLVGKIFPQIELQTDDKFVAVYYDGRATFRRRAALPEQCTVKRDNNSALYNFDTFWQYFQENYPAFELRGIDWGAIRKDYRPRVKEGMSAAELLALLGEIVEKINDPHIFITNDKQGQNNISFGSPDPHGLAAAVRRAIPGKTTDEYRSAASKIEAAIETEIRYDLLHGKFHTAQNERLTWGMLTGDVGYLRNSLAYGLFAPGMTREQMYSQLDETLDKIFNDLSSSKALIIDVTTNTGGAGFISDYIARRVIQKPFTAYMMKTKALDGFDIKSTKILEPSSGPRFSGPVIVLVSSNTVSAGEHLPLVLAGLPNVILFGETTLGSTGSFTMFGLPNGDRVSVANDVFTDRNGVWHEKRGIPPDIQAVVFNPAKLVTGYRDFVNSAIKLAKSRIKKTHTK